MKCQFTLERFKAACDARRKYPDFCVFRTACECLRMTFPYLDLAHIFVQRIVYIMLCDRTIIYNLTYYQLLSSGKILTNVFLYRMLKNF